MALWDKLSNRGNVDDRRGNGPSFVGGVSGITGLALIAAFTLLSGGSLEDVANQVLQSALQQPTTSYDTEEFNGSDSYEVFASTILGSTNDFWTGVFNKTNTIYTEPTLVLFRDRTESSCGGAYAEVGPHYCPSDQTIYLDERFFDELKERLGGNNGDVAQAYVIAHEVGHHVQHLRGIDEGVTDNISSIKLELQADCYAGFWAHSLKDKGVFEEGEIKEALEAAAAVGDDRIQQKTTGRVNPESWTHGSAAERTEWFTTGFNTTDVSACNTFT